MLQQLLFKVVSQSFDLNGHVTLAQHRLNQIGLNMQSPSSKPMGLLREAREVRRQTAKAGGIKRAQSPRKKGEN